jgi:hypothetical protein
MSTKSLPFLGDPIGFWRMRRPAGLPAANYGTIRDLGPDEHHLLPSTGDPRERRVLIYGGRRHRLPLDDPRRAMDFSRGFWGADSNSDTLAQRNVTAPATHRNAALADEASWFCWILADRLGGNTSAEHTYAWSLGGTGTADAAQNTLYGIGLSAAGRPLFTFEHSTKSRINVTPSSGAAVSIGDWHALAVVRTKPGADYLYTFYVDGEPYGTATNSFHPDGGGSTRHTMGGSWHGSLPGGLWIHNFTGRLQDCVFLSTALSAADVEALSVVDAEVAAVLAARGLDGDVVVHYPCDEAADIIDLGRGGTHLRLSGAVAVRHDPLSSLVGDPEDGYIIYDLATTLRYLSARWNRWWETRLSGAPFTFAIWSFPTNPQNNVKRNFNSFGAGESSARFPPQLSTNDSDNSFRRMQRDTAVRDNNVTSFIPSGGPRYTRRLMTFVQEIDDSNAIHKVYVNDSLRHTFGSVPAWVPVAGSNGGSMQPGAGAIANYFLTIAGNGGVGTGLTLLQGHGTVAVYDFAATAEQVAEWYVQGTGEGVVLGGGVVFPVEESVSKTQFVSTEDLQLVFTPFVNGTTGERFTGTDSVSLTIKKPNGDLVDPAIVPTWDGDVHLWVATVPTSEFQEGVWLIRATSDGEDSLDQFKTITWGDYVDDIQETRQAALGRWRINGTVLELYEDDGETVFKSFNLRDAEGNPTNTRIFDKDPV